MAINRYDQQAQSNYFNTFVPLPYNELMNTVASRQQQLDRAQTQMDESYEQAQLFNAIPGSKDEEEIKKIQSFISDWSGKWYNEDMSDPVIMRQAMNEYRSKIDRPFIKDAESSYQSWRANQEVKRRYQMEGKYNELLDDDPASGYSSRERGVYSHMTPALQDVNAAANEYFKPLKGSILKDKYGNPLKDPDGYHRIGVTNTDIERVVDEQWRDFADSPAGKQAIRIAARQHGRDENKEREQLAKDILTDIGKRWTWEDITGSRTPREQKGDKSDIPSPYSGLFPTSPAGITSDDPNWSYRKASNQVEKMDDEIATLTADISSHEKGEVTVFGNEGEAEHAKRQLSDLKEKRDVIARRLEEAKTRVDNTFNTRTDQIKTDFTNSINSKVKQGQISAREAQIFTNALEGGPNSILNTTLSLVEKGASGFGAGYDFVPNLLIGLGNYYESIFGGAFTRLVEDGRFEEIVNNNVTQNDPNSTDGAVESAFNIAGDIMSEVMRESKAKGQGAVDKIDMNIFPPHVREFREAVNSIKQLEKDRQKQYKSQYNKLEQETKQETFALAPVLIKGEGNAWKVLDPNAGEKGEYINGAGIGRIYDHIKANPSAYGYEFLSQEGTGFEKLGRRVRNALSNKNSDTIKEILTHAFSETDGYSTNITEYALKRNEKDNSYSIKVAVRKDGEQIGNFRVKIPSIDGSGEDRIGLLLEDLFIQKPYEITSLSLDNGATIPFAIPNPQKIRIQHEWTYTLATDSKGKPVAVVDIINKNGVYYIREKHNNQIVEKEIGTKEAAKIEISKKIALLYGRPLTQGE